MIYIAIYRAIYIHDKWYLFGRQCWAMTSWQHVAKTCSGLLVTGGIFPAIKRAAVRERRAFLGIVNQVPYWNPRPRHVNILLRGLFGSMGGPQLTPPMFTAGMWKKCSLVDIDPGDRRVRSGQLCASATIEAQRRAAKLSTVWMWRFLKWSCQCFSSDHSEHYRLWGV